MTASLSWEDIDNELGRIWDEINREQGKLFNRAMSLKGKLFDIEELRNRVKEEIAKKE